MIAARFLLDRCRYGRGLRPARKGPQDRFSTARDASCLLNDARVIAFTSGELTGQQMGDICLAHGERIHRLASVTPPFVFSLSASGLRRKHLNVR